MNKHKTVSGVIFFLVLVFVMTAHYIAIPKIHFPGDSETCVTGMIAAGVLNLDMHDIHFGMNAVSCDGILYDGPSIETHYNAREGNSSMWFAFNSPKFADHDVQLITTRKQQLGIQGWFLYWLGRTYSIIHLSGKAYFYFARGFYALLTALVVTAVSFALNKACDNLMAACFYCACFCSTWITDFASNLYFVPFTWFLPMLFGIMCMNRPDRKILWSVLVFLSVVLKCLCGYEHVTCVMMSTVVFSGTEYFFCLKSDKQRASLMLKTSLWAGISAIAGFFVALILHAYVRGDGNIADGLMEIYRADVIRSTFGSDGMFLRFAYIFRVTVSLFLRSSGGWAALILLVLAVISSYCAGVRHKIPVKKDVILLLLSFLSSMSWIILAAGHGEAGLIINYVIWYMPFIPAALYVFIRQRLAVLIPDPEKQNVLLQQSAGLLMRMLWLS